MSKTNGSGRIYWVGGSKGGVGKSMMTVATLDHLLERGASCSWWSATRPIRTCGRRTGGRSRWSSSTSMRWTDRSTSSTRATGAARGSWW